MTGEIKRKAVTYLTLALALTVLIGASLSRLRFQPGLPLPSVADGQVFVAPVEGERVLGAPISLFLKIILSVAVLVFIGYLAYRLIRGVNWREALKNAFSTLFILILVSGIIAFVVALLPKAQGEPAPELLPPPPLALTSPLGPVPSMLIWLVSIGLFCAALLAALWMLRPRAARAPEAWAIEAEKARQDLLAGGDLQNVILECYRRMSEALLQEQGIEREAAMTTTEFERLLAAKGAPREPVHRLTRLFELVRYGHQQTGAGDEEMALRSLDAILKHSRASGRDG